MKQIRLIAEDFDTLNVNSPLFSAQYESPSDCPIARASKRMGLFKKPSVAPYSIKEYDASQNRREIIGNFDEIVRIAKELKSGKVKYGVVKILN